MSLEYINRLGKERCERICQIVNNEVIMREAYLNGSFTGQLLCEQYGIDPRELSAVMNLRFGESFSSLLRRLRVNKACRLLEAAAQATSPCEMIGFRCGFNSRQSFYGAFRKEKGVTPQEYRKKKLNNNNE